MPGDFYEIDFIPVHRSDSGDAISARYQIGNQWAVHVIDGGYTSTAPLVSAHNRENYGTDLINSVVVTHPDQDHAEGLAPILEQFRIGELWMLCPWHYAEELLPHFTRYNDAGKLRARLRDDYPYIAELERIAVKRRIKIRQPFQGQQIGPFTLLAPHPMRWFELIIESERTPQRSVRSRSLMGGLLGLAPPMASFVRAGWAARSSRPNRRASRTR
jgi:hypothetical protein